MKALVLLATLVSSAAFASPAKVCSLVAGDDVVLVTVRDEAAASINVNGESARLAHVASYAGAFHGDEVEVTGATLRSGDVAYVTIAGQKIEVSLRSAKGELTARASKSLRSCR